MVGYADGIRSGGHEWTVPDPLLHTDPFKSIQLHKLSCSKKVSTKRRYQLTFPKRWRKARSPFREQIAAAAPGLTERMTGAAFKWLLSRSKPSPKSQGTMIEAGPQGTSADGGVITYLFQGWSCRGPHRTNQRVFAISSCASTGELSTSRAIMIASISTCPISAIAWRQEHVETPLARSHRCIRYSGAWRHAVCIARRD